MLGKTFSNQFSFFKRIVDTWNASQLSSRALSIFSSKKGVADF